jgi:hypothetical protein
MPKSLQKKNKVKPRQLEDELEDNYESDNEVLHASALDEAKASTDVVGGRAEDPSEKRKKEKVIDYELGDYGQSSGSRGYLRSGQKYRRTNKGHYMSIKELARAHPRIFSTKPTFSIIGSGH